MQTHVERPVAPVPSTSSAAVQPLDMIPGGMWAQVGWWNQVWRNVAQSLATHYQPVRRCHGNGCYQNITAIGQVQAVTQEGVLCAECARFRDRLAELREGRPLAPAPFVQPVPVAEPQP